MSALENTPRQNGGGVSGEGIPVNRRNRAAWEQAIRKREGLLIGYVVGGDPNMDKSLEIAREIMTAGVDILEIGVPSRSPRLDGEIIRRGHRRALRHEYAEGGHLPDEFWSRLREQLAAPIWAMGYKKELVDSGLYRRMAHNGWIDGLVLPDCAEREQREIGAELAASGVDVIRFVHSAMSDDEVRAAVDGATIIYAQLYSGATGDPLAQFGNLGALCERARRYTGAMIVAGFGLRSAKRVRMAIDSGFDGAVVGTALVARSERGEQDSLYRLIADMKLETRRGGV